MYCVFWIPTVYHHLEDRTVIQNKIERDISDASNDTHHVEVELRPNRDIIVKNQQSFLELRFIDNSRNGLYVYKFEKQDNCPSFISHEIPNAIYHIIKEFFHEHEFHEKNADSLLQAYTSNKLVNIKEINNEAILHYLTIYEKKFLAYSRQATELTSQLKTLSKEISGKGKLLRGYRTVDVFCGNALGEFLYCTTLINSKYICLDNSASGSNDKTRRVVHNIKNSIDNIRLVKDKSLSDYNFKTTNISLAIAVPSFIIAILGIIITIKGLQTPHYVDEIRSHQKSIVRQININADGINTIDKKLQNTNNCIETLRRDLWNKMSKKRH